MPTRAYYPLPLEFEGGQLHCSLDDWRKALTRAPGTGSLKYDVIEEMARRWTGIENPTRAEILRAGLRYHLRYFETFAEWWLTHHDCRRVPLDDGEHLFWPPSGLGCDDNDSRLVWSLCEAWNSARKAEVAAVRKDEAAFWRHLSAATEGYLWNLAADSVKSREHGMVGAMLKSTAPRDEQLRAAFDAEKATTPSLSYKAAARLPSILAITGRPLAPSGLRAALARARKAPR